jgi:DNA-binding NtrC family response regulator
MEKPSEIRVLALVSTELRESITRQLAPLGAEVTCVDCVAEITSRIRGTTYEVAILPATLPNAEWEPLWDEMAQARQRPSILVYARRATFRLWAEVLDSGGYDLIVEPFSDLEFQETVSRAAQSFRNKLRDEGEQR